MSRNVFMIIRNVPESFSKPKFLAEFDKESSFCLIIVFWICAKGHSDPYVNKLSKKNKRKENGKLCPF